MRCRWQALGLAFLGLVALAGLACGAGDEEAAPRDGREATGSAPPTTAAAVTIDPAEIWNSWHFFYPQAIPLSAISADVVVRGLITSEVRNEEDGRKRQDVSLAVSEVYRGDAVRAGEEINVRWSLPPPIDHVGGVPQTPSRIFMEGEEYIVFLQEHSWLADESPEVAWHVEYGNSAFSLARGRVAGERPDPELVEQLTTLIREAPHPDQAVLATLERYGLERAGVLVASRVTVPDLPAVRGTLTFPDRDSLPWHGEFRKIEDASVAEGFDPESWPGRALFVIDVTVAYPVEGSFEPVEARFLTTAAEVVGGWLSAYYDVWPLSEIAAAEEAVTRAVETGSHLPARNRAGAVVNLVEWFGAESVVQIDSTRVPKDRRTLPADARELLVSALDQELPAQSLPSGPRELGAECSEAELTFHRDDGYGFGLVYNQADNRLYARSDGFSVEAPAAVAQALGMTPRVPGECPAPPSKPTPAASTAAVSSPA